MALETLKAVQEIDGLEFRHVGFGKEMEASENPFIIINDEENTIKFKIQNGPIKEVGVNGCQVDALLSTVSAIIMGLNEKFPCEENKLALKGLEIALDALALRKKNRE